MASQMPAPVAASSWKFMRPVRELARIAKAIWQGLFHGKRNRKVARWRSIPELKNLSSDDVERVASAFDPQYYLSKNLDVSEAGVDPLEHFLSLGWRENRNPSESFCTEIYMRYAPDVRESGVNPFVHWVLRGIHEERIVLPYQVSYSPKVSAIVPNYNHAPYLSRRIESILDQTYSNLEILILDDCSHDESRAIIESYCDKYPDRVRAVFNEQNSGNVFRQWRKGIDSTAGELVWICESDDFCDPDFLLTLVPYFRDNSVNIAFGRIQHTDSDGSIIPGLDAYREGAEPGIWENPLIRPACRWFTHGFGVKNIIPNVGGSLWRRMSLPDDVWDEAQKYSVVGDWYLYCQIAGGGQIAWDPKAISYFRQHPKNTSVASFTQPRFYQELEQLMLSLRRQWDVPVETVERFLAHFSEMYSHFGLEQKFGQLDLYCDERRILAQRRSRPHILIGLLGFMPGGGEMFPLQLANALHAAGWLVSMLELDSREAKDEMRAALNPAIPVYHAAWVEEYGAGRFIEDAGISIIHSHNIGVEFFFFVQWKIKCRIPYLITLHGSYDVIKPAKDGLARFTDQVTRFIYTADRNLLPFRHLDLKPSRFIKLPNAMPMDPRPFPRTRADMGIAADAVVFTLVARGVPDKGWAESISAFVRLRQDHPGRRMHLLLCGDGEEQRFHLARHGGDPDITFLGYQSCIHGLYAISDVALVPTRFAGESFPLCIIQALQIGTPVIASRVAEIEAMLAPQGGDQGGVLIEPLSDTDLFIEALEGAMAMMLSESRRRQYASAASKLGQGFDMASLASEYGSLYQRELDLMESLNSPG